MPRKDAILKIRLAEDLKAEVEAVADSTGETVAVIVRQALRDYIDRRRKPRTDYPGATIPALKVAESHDESMGKPSALPATDASPGTSSPSGSKEGAA
jgi:antitoxin component of RelBE/YafQ-DinJ toxin-antitoxin module